MQQGITFILHLFVDCFKVLDIPGQENFKY